MSKYRNYISSEVIAGTPSKLIEEIKEEIVYQINILDEKNYQDICCNMRLIIDVIETLEMEIEDDFILFKYNPVGDWYKEEDKEEIEYYKEECLHELR